MEQQQARVSGEAEAPQVRREMGETAKMNAALEVSPTQTRSFTPPAGAGDRWTKRNRKRRRKGRAGTHQAPFVTRQVPESKTDPHRLAREYLRRRTGTQGAKLIHRYHRLWWRYENGVYRALSDEEMRADVTTAVKELVDEWAARESNGQAAHVTTGLVSNVLNALLSQVELPDDRRQPSWLHSDEPSTLCISMANGLLDLERLLAGDGNALQSHTPLWFSPVKLPYVFEPDACCARWLGFLEEVLEKDADRIKLAQEWFGYCLTPDTSRQKFMILVGDGANGKTVFLNTLNAVVGEDNVSHVPLEILGKRFQAAATLGKLVNSVSEIGETHAVAEATLKAFTSGDRMQFEKKNKDTFEAYPTARLVFATNNPPRFRDKTDGIWRRLQVLPFRVAIPPERQDRQLSERLRQELPGIFNWAMEGLRRLRQREGFSEPLVSQAALKGHRAASDPERAFLLECYREDPQGQVSSADVQADYAEWCEGRQCSVNVAELGQAMFRVFPGVERRRLGPREARQRVYVGVRRVHGVQEDSAFSSSPHTEDFVQEEEEQVGPPGHAGHGTRPQAGPRNEGEVARRGQGVDGVDTSKERAGVKVNVAQGEVQQ